MKQIIGKTVTGKVNILLMTYIVALLFTRFLVLDNFVKVFAGLPSIVILPYFFGEFLIRLLKKMSLYDRLQNVDLLDEFITNWFSGALLLSIIAIALQYLHMFVLFYFILIIVPLFTTILKNVQPSDVEVISFKKDLPVFFCISLSFVIGIIPVIISSLIAIPFPWFGEAIDLPAFNIQPILRALDDKYLMLEVRVVDVILGIVTCFLANVDPLYYLWGARFFFAGFFAVGIYFLTRELLNKQNTDYLTLIVVFFSSFILSGRINESGWAGLPLHSLFFVVPAEVAKSNSILFSMFPWVMVLVVKNVNKMMKKREYIGHIFLIAVFLAATFVYYAFPLEVLGFPPFFREYYLNPIILPVIFIIGFVFLRYMKTKCDTRFLLNLYIIMLVIFNVHEREAILFFLAILLYLFVCFVEETRFSSYFVKILAVIAILYMVAMKYLDNSYFGVVNDVIKLFAGGAQWTVDFNYRFRNFVDANGVAALGLLTLGCLIASASDRLWKRILAVFLMLFLIYFSPVDWSYRIYEELNPYMSCLIALPFLTVLRSNRVNKIRICLQRKKEMNLHFRYKVLCIFILIMFIPLVTYPLIERFSFESEFFPQHGIQNFMTKEELETALWIREHTKKETILISDYFTLFTLTGLSNKIWVIERFVTTQSMSMESVSVLERIKYKIFLSNSSKTAYFEILSIKPTWTEKIYLDYTNMTFTKYDYLVIVSKRTCEWALQKGWAWGGNDIGMTFKWKNEWNYCENILRIFNNETYFRLIYSNDFLYVFRLA